MLHQVWTAAAVGFPAAALGILAAAMPAAAAELDRSEPAARRLNLPATPHNYTNIDWPEHFAAVIERFDNTPADNPITDEGATLGRVLFYDPTLSVSGGVSCASCHQQSKAFTDPARVSLGHDGREVARNSMSLINVRFYQRGRFFWDERARTLEQQVLMPIVDDIEMGHDLDALPAQVAADPIYPKLFAFAFGDAEVTADRIAKALSQFVRSIVSYQSPYDVGLAAAGSINKPFANFTEQENLGKEVFLERGRCASCHLSNALPFNPNVKDGPMSTGPRQLAFFYLTRPAVNGIDYDTDDMADAGVGKNSGAPMDRGRFKSPSLRNVAVTGPYMHDGRIRTLDGVLEHYNWSIQPHENLDGRLVDLQDGMGLPEVPKVALAKFLETLTDQSVLTDEKFSDPFIR